MKPCEVNDQNGKSGEFYVKKFLKLKIDFMIKPN